MNFKSLALLVLAWNACCGRTAVFATTTNDVQRATPASKVELSSASMSFLEKQIKEADEVFRRSVGDGSPILLLSRILEDIPDGKAHPRQDVVKSLIGEEVFHSLESLAVDSFHGSANEQIKIAAMRLLKCGLGSPEIDDSLRNIVAEGIDSMKGNSQLRVPFEVLFSAAEVLLIGGEEIGLPILSYSLRSDRVSDRLKQRALKAYFKTSHFPKETTIRALLLSKDVETAFFALCLLERAPANKINGFLDEIIERLDWLVHEGNALSDGSIPHVAFLSEITSMLSNACRHNALSKLQENTTRTVVVDGLRGDDETTQEMLMSIFVLVSDDTTIETSRRMLSSRNPAIRARAALSLSNCSREVIASFSPQLIRMLSENKSEEGLSLEQMFSLYTLRRGLGESHIRPMISAEEFSVIKRYVVSQYTDD